MAYQANKPLPPDRLAISVTDIELNFDSLNTFLTANHVGFNVGDQGKHTKVVFPDLLAPVGFAVGEVGLYNAVSPYTTVNELFFRREAPSVGIPITASRKAPFGWSYLPSGLLLKWGTIFDFDPEAQAGDQYVVFPVAALIPPFTTLYNVSISSFNLGNTDTNSFTRLGSVNAVTFPYVSPLGFHVFNSSRTGMAAAVSGFSYLAIGE